MKNYIALALVTAVGVSFAPQEPKGKDLSETSERQETFFKALLEAGKKDFAEKIDSDIAKACRVLLDGGNNYRDDELFDRLVGTVEVPRDVLGYENLGIIRQENHLALGMGILRGAKDPKFFYFVWYRPDESSKWFIDKVSCHPDSMVYWTFRK